MTDKPPPTGAERRRDSGWRHPSDWDLYTPITGEIIRFMYALRDANTSWRNVAAITETRLRVLRRVRTGERKTISMTLLDRILTRLETSVTVENFPWYTPDELIALGIWDDTTYIGDQVSTLTPEQIRKRRKERKLKRYRLEQKRKYDWIEPR